MRARAVAAAAAAPSLRALHVATWFAAMASGSAWPPPAPPCWSAPPFAPSAPEPALSGEASPPLPSPATPRSPMGA